jgi:hypothetical protein
MAADLCEPELVRTPHTTPADGWLWSAYNPPLSVDSHLPGKWMLFPPCGEAVAAWGTVAAAARAGHFWLAKIAPRAQPYAHLICVYTPDFTDLPGVEAVAHRLDDLGLIQRTLYYKPDIFTYAGIYASTQRGGASTYRYVPSERRLEPTAGLARALALLAEGSGEQR